MERYSITILENRLWEMRRMKNKIGVYDYLDSETKLAYEKIKKRIDEVKSDIQTIKEMNQIQ